MRTLFVRSSSRVVGSVDSAFARRRRSGHIGGWQPCRACACRCWTPRVCPETPTSSWPSAHRCRRPASRYIMPVAVGPAGQPAAHPRLRRAAWQPGHARALHPGQPSSGGCTDIQGAGNKLKNGLIFDDLSALLLADSGANGPPCQLADVPVWCCAGRRMTAVLPVATVLAPGCCGRISAMRV